MATVAVQVQSILNTALYDTYVTSDTVTVQTLKSYIFANTAVSAAWYELHYNGEVLANANTLASYSIGNVQVKTANRISDLATREARQLAKLDLASLKRGESYDITKLPTRYSGNTIVDNANAGGLVSHRPWNLDPVIVTRQLQLFLDPSDTDSYPGSGTAFYDLSNNDYTTALVGAPTYSTTHFNYPNTTARYVDTNQSLASESFTVGGWFRTSAAGIKMTICKETTGGWPWNYRIWFNGGTIIGDIAQNAGANESISSTLTNYNNGAWYLVYFTRGSGVLRLYVNGVEIKQQASTLVGSIENAQEVWIGRSAFTQGGVSPTGSYQYVGDLGQWFVYHDELTPAEVLQNYNATKTTYGL